MIRLAVMMYVCFPLSLRNMEDLLAERGIGISLQKVRFRCAASRTGDGIWMRSTGRPGGEVLESFATKTGDKAAALTFMKKALKRHGRAEVASTGDEFALV